MTAGVQRLEWVEARTRNYGPMVRFYRDLLGLPAFFEEDDKEFIQFRVGDSETYLALLGTQNPGGNFVPAIEVDDLDKAVQGLEGRGISFPAGIQTFTHLRLAEFADPDGNRLQLFEWRKTSE